MGLLLTGHSDSYAQLLAVLIIFVLVLGLTAFTTRWIANYQKQQNGNSNIEVLDTARIANNKYIQIIRVGETYMVIAVCKDTVTMLGQVPREQLKNISEMQKSKNFRELFENAMKKDSGKDSERKEQTHEK